MEQPSRPLSFRGRPVEPSRGITDSALPAVGDKTTVISDRPSSLRRPLHKRDSDNPSEYSTNDKLPSSGLRRQLLKRESDNLSDYATGDRPPNGGLRRQLLKRESDNISDYDRPRSVRLSGGLYNGPGGGSPSGSVRRFADGSGEARLSGGLPRLALSTRLSGELDQDSPRSQLDKSESQRGFFATGPQGHERSPSGRFANSPKPGTQSPPRPGMSERISSNRSLGGSALEAQRGEMVRVVSQRAITSQVAKAYLQTIEQQKAIRDKAARAKEEREALEVKKKTVRRMLGSFSMYQIDLSLGLEEPAPRPPPIVARVSNLGRKPSAEASVSSDALQEEYESVISALLARRQLSKALLMWRTVVAYRKYLRSQQNFLVGKTTPMVPLPRRKSRKYLQPRNHHNNNFAPRPSRMSVIRRPSTDAAADPSQLETPSAWFDLSHSANGKDHHHQLNLGRRNTRTRLSVTGREGAEPPVRVRRSTLKPGAFRSPATVPENRPLVEEDESSEVPPLPPRSPLLESQQRQANSKAPKRTPAGRGPPPSLAITVMKEPKGLGLPRRRSWSKMGFEAFKNMFSSPTNKLLSRIPSKERLVERPSKATA